MLTAVKVDNSVLFQYDTTFTLTGLYISVLSYIHPFLVKNNTNTSPVIPLAYFYHEKKYEKTHNEFFRFVNNNCTKLIITLFMDMFSLF